MKERRLRPFTSLADFNAALARHVCAHSTLVFAPASHATRLGKHSGELLVEPKGPVAVLEGMIRGAAEDYLHSLPADPAHPFLANRPQGLWLTAWSIVLEAQGYQLPHIHNAGPNTLILMVYFSKNWKKGDPGGTYITPEEDESKMIFEPYNLDNTTIIFHDGAHAGHGVRYITKDVERRAIQIYFEKYSPETGWSVYPVKRELREI